MAYTNPITQLLRTPTPQVSAQGLNPTTLLTGGLNSFQKVADQLDEVKRNRALSQLLSSGQTNLSQLLGVRGTSPNDAAILSQAAMAPELAKQKMALDIYKAQPKPKGYGMVTDDYGNTYSYNKDTGSYSIIKGDGSNLGVSPKNVVLKSVTSRDENGVETTVQVPFNKLTGEPLTTAGGDTTAGVGVKQPPKLSNTMQLPTGETVYVDATGKPIQNDKGQYLVKSQGTSNVKKTQAKIDMVNTLNQLDTILTRIKTNPTSVGSIGSDFMNWVGNKINDIVKVPTADRLNRNQIEAVGGVIAAGLRKGLESGVMTESDYTRYQKLVPNVDDSPQEAIYKGQMLMQQLSNQYGVLPAGYKRQYNTETGEYRIVKDR